MTTSEEIRRRVEDADTTRCAQRAAAAQQIGELAHRRATLAEQVDDLERQLGDAIAAARHVIDINELARFTDVRAADLTRWCEARKTTRAKRPRSATRTRGTKDTVTRPADDRRTTPPSQTSPPAGRAAPNSDAADATTPGMAPVS